MKLLASNNSNPRVLRYQRNKKQQIRRSGVIAIVLFLCVSSLIGPFFEYINIKVPTTNFVAENTNSCQLISPYEGPLPVILMALGRSGSSVTWDTMARLTGDTNVAYEVTGGNQTKSRHFFDSINPNVGSSWPIERLCFIQKRVISQTSHSGIAGFQWKPYKDVFNHYYSQGALEEISKHQDPFIRVIYLTRNVIDRRQRHQGFIRTKEVPHHCTAGDDECVQKHKKRSKNVILPTGQDLIHHIDHALAHDEYVKKKMSRAGVKYLHVSYEKLFHTNTAAEWMKIFQFLKRGPAANLTIDMVRETFSMVSTSSRKHKEMISNYDEVKETLSGTRHFHLLH